VRTFRVAPRPASADERVVASTALVPASSREIEAARERLVERLDAFAASAPTMRQALGGLGRAFARKAVRLVVWRRRAA
jgi:hypothetical protein